MRNAVLIGATLGLVATGCFALVSGVLARPSICDGEVPVWYPSNCSVPALVEYLWPSERLGAPTYCTGMCTDFDSGRMREEWIRTHGTDSLAD